MNQFSDIVPILIVGVVLWLGGLTVVFYRLLSHYRRIAARKKDGDLVSVIDAVLKKEEENNRKLANIVAELAKLDKNAQKPIQKVGMVRFNPFNETGGDQSFCLCLLDRNEDGFIVTSLHTRETTRVYIKPVIKSKSKYELSKEERKALIQALSK